MDVEIRRARWPRSCRGTAGTRRPGGAGGTRRSPCPSSRRARRTATSCRGARSRGCAAPAGRAASASSGCVRSSAWICDFSSTHSTSARSGGFRYSPTMSRTFSMNSGSFDSLKVSVRCGWRPNARQMRLMALWVRPQLARHRPRAPVRRVPRVVSSVRVITRSTSASVIVRGAPGRGSSSRPSSRCARKRERHLPHRRRDSTRARSPTCVLFFPSAHARMIRARWASAWLVFGRRAQRSSVSRSSAVSTSGLSTGDVVVISVVIMTVDHDNGPHCQLLHDSGH